LKLPDSRLLKSFDNLYPNRLQKAKENMKGQL